jgi:preprotein translocase subunit SecF
MIEIIKNPKLNFIGARRFTYIISALLVLNGLWAVYKIATGQAKMGLDFTGGVTTEVQFTKDINVNQVRKILDEQKMPGATLQQVGPVTDKTFMIRVGSQELSGENASGRLTEALKQGAGDDQMTVLEQNEIGGVVSAQLKEKAVLALFWSLVAILIYIAIRFKFKFAVTATIATFHDVLAVLGIMVLLNKDIDLLMITALLTIAGYSLTDTVVVFDRIRENMKHILKKTYDELVNDSINEVLSRTLITSFTTFAVALSLFIFGGEVLHTFSQALCIGIIVGTYSSDLLASPIIVDWENHDKKNRAAIKK